MKHPLGCHRTAGRTYFTLYAPFAQKLQLLLFNKCDDNVPHSIYPMRSVSGGFWEYSDIRDFSGSYYAFKVDEQEEPVPIPMPNRYPVSMIFTKRLKSTFIAMISIGRMITILYLRIQGI